MKKHFLPLLFLFIVFMGCMPNAQEERILHHRAELQYDLWKEDTAALEQVFSLREDTVTTIVCEGGTKLVIPAHAFVPEAQPDQPVEGPVELRILEVDQPAEMIRHYLSTQEAGGKLLESAGMVYLQAYAGGKRLQLKEGKEIILGFPKKENFTEASLFHGVAASGEALRWEKEEELFDLKKAIIDTYFGGGATANIKIVTAEETLAAASSDDGTDERDAVPGGSGKYPVVLAKDETVTELLGGLLEGYNDYFFFSTPQLSWISCDRFVGEKVTNLMVDVSGFPQNTLYYLLFEDLNALMTGHREAGEPEENNPVFEHVPAGRPARLVVAFNRGGDYYLGQQEIVTADGKVVRLQPEETSKQAIADFLKKLGEEEGLTASR